MHPKTRAAIDAVCDAAKTDDQALPQIRAAIEKLAELRVTEAAMEGLSTPVLIQRRIGASMALQVVGSKAANIGRKLGEQGDREAEELFARFAARVMQLADAEVTAVETKIAELRSVGTVKN